MDWPRLLLVASLLIGFAQSVSVGGGCNPLLATNGVCTSGSIDGGAAHIGGSTGSTGSVGGTGGGNGGSQGLGGPPTIWKCMQVSCAREEPGAEPITLSDIASFRPTPGVQRMQPNGWIVPGLDANFYAITGQHVVHGTLLGQPASVRFTPVAFHWSYGDGIAATRPTKGATWQALGIPEFEPTPTSHIYANEGEYTIRLVIDFAAEYRFAGSPYYPIDGVIPLRANDLHVSVDGAKTVLVEHDCAANPGGPGC